MKNKDWLHKFGDRPWIDVMTLLAIIALAAVAIVAVWP